MSDRWMRVEIWFGPNAPKGVAADELFDLIADVAHDAELPDGCDPHVSAEINAATPEWAQP